MHKKTLIRAVAASVCLMPLAGTAFAQSEAYTSAPVDVYAGPASDYPVVAQLPPGQELEVLGCVADYSWCDVAAPGLRGWVYGGYLSYPYDGSQEPIITYGAQFGVPIVVFSFGNYWDHYYRDRPWYHDRDRWSHHPPPRGGPPQGGGGGPTVNPRPVIRGGPPQPQGTVHEPPQQPQGTAHAPPQEPPGMAHAPPQQQSQPRPDYGHAPQQPQQGYAHAPPPQAAPRPAAPPVERGGGQVRGGNEDRDRSSNH
ncbi:peptide-binding protein [Trinickia terrae]|uniref:Peptide-binding protein n=1 Tax=Trinickia terrae TaxID=2571161 RepID=A0A4U1I439_9BURK|nr:SH3 domain-containing protein [Trinickia terrae]TKC88002.1 peptide-binding protein [Trinickia terrae]